MASIYPAQLIVTGLVLHSIAILCTVFRFAYRCWTRQFWWEDVWAAFALISDVICLAWIWLQESTSFPTWTRAVALTCVPWAARMSVIFFIIRVSNHSGHKVHRQITHLIAVSFACMWAVLLAQKVRRCIFHSCYMGESVALSQLITDVIADVSLIAAPMHLWKNVGFSRSRRILILSAFGASLLITAVTIPHSIILFEAGAELTIIYAHVKAALSLVICNLLVIVTFTYRVCSKETFDLDQSLGLFSSVVMAQVPISANAGTSLSVPEERRMTMVQTGATKPKMENSRVLFTEEGTSTDGWPESLEDEG
ncbi:hypothetical protein EDB19DRAFT_414159 [Suillus lakei]|nr:hypothetical protein EDB19DRAFT_414159 [Suillus lakei]